MIRSYFFSNVLLFRVSIKLLFTVELKHKFREKRNPTRFLLFYPYFCPFLGKVMVNGAEVTRADVAVTNGVIHVIDTVLMPPK